MEKVLSWEHPPQLKYKHIMGHWVVESRLWTFVYSLQNKELTRVGYMASFQLLPSSTTV